MCNIKAQEIVVKVTDFILTPLSCAALVNEIIKTLLFQKSQIPYPYNWLISVINRKRKSNDCESNKDLSVDRHYRVVSSAFDTVEEIMKSINKEFVKQNSPVLEIVIMFGTTPQTPKEAFVIKMPTIDVRHFESNHTHTMQKNQQKILRHIFFSEDWMRAMDHTIPSTNMYIMMKKEGDIVVDKDNFFLPIRQFSLPNKIKSTIINLHYEGNDVYSCCDNLSVYKDSSEVSKTKEVPKSTIICEDDDQRLEKNYGHWYQAKLMFKGYKDYFINKRSATELF